MPGRCVRVWGGLFCKIKDVLSIDLMIVVFFIIGIKKEYKQAVNKV